jgi:hypothetical protein
MDGYLSNKPSNFVDDPEKLYRLRRREAHQAKKLDFVDSKSEDKGSKESPKNFHHLKVLGRIDFHRWVNNRRKNARSGSYAPQTSEDQERPGGRWMTAPR